MRGDVSMRPVRLALLCFMALPGCVAFRPQAAPALPPGEGKTRLGLGYLSRDDVTVEIEGRFERGVFMATRVEIEEPDDEIEIKSTLQSIDPDAGTVGVGGLRMRTDRKTVLRDADGEDVPGLGALAAGAWVKVEAIERGGDLVLRKLTVRRRGPEEPEEIQGTITYTRLNEGRLRVAGIDVTLLENVPVLWDVADQDPPPPAERGRDVRRGPASELRRVRVIDDENWRPEDQFTIGDSVTIGGEIEWELEWRENHDLRDAQQRDRLVHEVSTQLEVSAEISRQLFAFGQLNYGHDFEIFDERGRLEFGDRLRLGETFLLADDIPVEGVALQIGRQDFDHGREWVMDELIDGVRAYLNFGDAMLELSISEVLLDPSREQDGIRNYLAGFHFEPLEDHKFFAYALHRAGGKLVDLDRTHVGISGEGEVGDFEWWLDIGWVTGKEDGNRVDGWGIDFSVMYVFPDVELEPSVYFGFARGSGDGDTSSGTDHNFRQTGLHDNNDRFNGVTSFRYLGELVRPEVSNMTIFTLGAGIRLGERTSIDVVFHQYRQVVAATTLRDTRLRFAPQGLSPDIGWEVDLIIGIEDFRPIQMEIVLAYFEPGRAFEPLGEDPAWFLTYKVEFSF